ncbi:hypothetical protein [Crassaminicella indica]|uniref:Uncharacterized protein n=1 Tax=Crassaminicella indica TaxID=2855394 RepID=A0ABX8R7V5_9CLOT|nr:hypothetical protein [Crassaminicella indica]QXM05115.1 hypothetical protein KVH43_06805 [Crassaminicella indica]
MTGVFQIINTILFVFLVIFVWKFANIMIENTKATQNLTKKIEEYEKKKKL